MRYVRIKFTDDEYEKVKNLADGSDMIVSKWVHDKAIKSRVSKEIKQFYFFNRMIYLLELISSDIKNKA